MERRGLVGSGLAWPGALRHGGLGGEWTGLAGRYESRRSRLGMACCGEPGLVPARRSWIVKERPGGDRSVVAVEAGSRPAGYGWVCRVAVRRAGHGKEGWGSSG